MTKKIIFISWTNFNRHSQLLAQNLGIEIFFIKNFIRTRKLTWHLFFWLDYLSKSIRTIRIIWNSKPDVIIVQNPPSILPILVVLLKIFGSFKVMVDSHNAAFEKPWKHIPFNKWALRHADIVTIHNNQLLYNLKKNTKYSGINFKVLNSSLTDFSKFKKDDQGPPYILIITTFSVDEPVKKLFDGITEFQKNHNNNLKFKVTGNYNKNYKLYLKFRENEDIEFLGYLSEQEYTSYLINSFGIISLSTRNDVQQFAITEAISAEIPFISNNNSTNKDLFNDKMILTELLPSSISQSIDAFIKNRKMLGANIKKIKKNISEKWNKDFVEIKDELDL